MKPVNSFNFFQMTCTTSDIILNIAESCQYFEKISKRTCLQLPGGTCNIHLYCPGGTCSM
jgi:hypothetical protein